MLVLTSALKLEILDLAKTARVLGRRVGGRYADSVTFSDKLKYLLAQDDCKPRKVQLLVIKLRNALEAELLDCNDVEDSRAYEGLIRRCAEVVPYDGRKGGPNDTPMTRMGFVKAIVTAVSGGVFAGSVFFFAFLPFEVPPLQDDGVGAGQLANLLEFVGQLLVIPMGVSLLIFMPGLISVSIDFGRPTRVVRWIAITTATVAALGTVMLLLLN